MKILVYFLLLINLYDFHIKEEQFLSEISHLQKEERDTLKKKAMAKKLTKKKVKYLFKMLKAEVNENLSRKLVKTSKFYKNMQLEIVNSPRNLKNYEKLVKLYKGLKNKNRRKLQDIITHATETVFHSVGEIIKALIQEFTDKKKFNDVYLKPLSTAFVLYKMKKQIDETNDFKVKNLILTSKQQRLEVLNKTLREQLEDLQSSSLSLNRVLNKVEQIHKTFNYRLDSKIDLLREIND
jgi:hypothetical protein